MRIQGVHHIGIRVSDERRSLEFYGRLGFAVVYRDARDPVLVLKNDAGVEVNLIVNAAASFDGRNRLMDVPEKMPGYTHVALRVDSISDAEQSLRAWGVAITEGPVKLGSGSSLFVRDPDANVIEFHQDAP